MVKVRFLGLEGGLFIRLIYRATTNGELYGMGDFFE